MFKERLSSSTAKLLGVPCPHLVLSCEIPPARSKVSPPGDCSSRNSRLELLGSLSLFLGLTGSPSVRRLLRESLSCPVYPTHLLHYSRLPVPGQVSLLLALCPHRGQMFKIIFWSITINLPIQTTNWPLENIEAGYCGH